MTLGSSLMTCPSCPSMWMVFSFKHFLRQTNLETSHYHALKLSVQALKERIPIWWLYVGECVNIVPMLYPGMRARGWSGSPELGTGQTSCVLGSQEDSHWRTESDSKRTSCGWCAADWPVSWSFETTSYASYCGMEREWKERVRRESLKKGLTQKNNMHWSVWF